LGCPKFNRGFGDRPGQHVNNGAARLRRRDARNPEVARDREDRH
jgi:hypothetical protein